MKYNITLKNKMYNFKLIYIELIIISILFLFIGQNNLISWLTFLIFFLFIYLFKNSLLKFKRLYSYSIWTIITAILLLSFIFTRPLPSIRGLIVTTDSIANANKLGYISSKIKPSDINSFIMEQREFTNKMADKYKIPENIIIEKTRIKNVNCEWVSTKNSPTDKVIIYLHGGAYNTGNLETSRPFAVRVSRESGYKVLVVDYALAPENPYPIGLNQTIEIYHWLLNNGYSASNIVILGDSAGGGLGFATVIKLREAKEKLPASLICISPWLDLTTNPENHKIIPHQGELDWLNLSSKIYATDESLQNRFISPMYTDYKGFPPLLIIAGGVDLIIHDINKAASKAKSDGVDLQYKIYEHMYHDFATSGDFIPESKAAVKIIAEYIQKHFNK